METITTISPSTNKPICSRPGISDAELAQLPSRSTAAFQAFSHTTTIKDRVRIVDKALDLLVERKAGLGQELSEQMGRPIAYTEGEITTAVARGKFLVKHCEECLRDVDGEPEAGFKRYIRKCPVGPILVIFAWNYPYLILVNALIPALLAGNTVIIKPSPQTPSIADHVEEVFAQAGLPRDVITTLHTGLWPKIEALIANPLIKLVCFTGSVENGRKVQRAAAGRIIPVALELGGKDPAYVRGDVDISWAAENIVDGAIFNSGQSCCAIERVYVAQSIYEAFWKEVQKVLQNYKLGNPLDKATQIGPVISKRSKELIREHIADALAKGAIDQTPANETFKNAPHDGNYVAPTLLINVNHGMKVMKEETFGPVIPVMPVANDSDALELMNHSDLGLTASIWTKDVAKGEELAAATEAGTCFVNRCDFPSPDLAWTGWKDSGKGVTLSKFGFDQFVKLKSFHVKGITT